jgi:hypothetical protein
MEKEKIMKIVFLISLLLALVLVKNTPADALVFPFPLAGVDSANVNTINQLFVEDYGTFSKQAVKIAPDSLPCSTRECALAAANTLSAEEVIFGSARKLGEKWILSGFRVRVKDGKQLSTARLDSKSIEDFEFAMKRMAEALAKEKSLEDVASIDNVTETEMGDAQHRRRQGFYAFGVKFGYLFPMGAKSYQRISERYIYDYSTFTSSYQYDTTQYKQVLITDFVNWFELPKDLALEWDLHVGWGAEFGSHFTLLKLFSRSDWAPYAGAGIGMDYVFPETYYGTSDPNKRNSGFALNAKGGMLLFRTYDFRVSVDAGYKIIFNDDMDQGITTGLGITWKKRSSDDGGSGRSPLVTGLAIIGGIVVTCVVIGLVAN